MDTRPGQHTKSDIENGPVEIVDLPINSLVIFHSFLYVDQRVNGRLSMANVRLNGQYPSDLRLKLEVPTIKENHVIGGAIICQKTIQNHLTVFLISFFLICFFFLVWRFLDFFCATAMDDQWGSSAETLNPHENLGFGPDNTWVSKHQKCFSSKQSREKNSFCRLSVG